MKDEINCNKNDFAWNDHEKKQPVKIGNTVVLTVIKCYTVFIGV